jgi:hypothetical protein
VTTPPDFGGRDIEEGLLEDLGGPQLEHPEDVSEERASAEWDAWDANEAHATGAVCARCGAVITAGQDARRRADRQWVHEICPEA